LVLPAGQRPEHTLVIVPIFEPNLDLLRQAFGNDIRDCQAELVKIALGWSRVYRVTLTRKGQGHSTRDTIIVKTIDPQGPSTLLEAERELRFYQTIHPKLSIPKPEAYFLTTDEATGFHVIVMQDLAPSHLIHNHPYRWAPDELKSVLRAYAYLHTSKVEDLNYPWLAPRHESLLDLEKIPEQVAIVQRMGIWDELPGLPDLIAYTRESSKKYESEHLTLLHGDTTPANALLPKFLDSHPATLIDWQDVGVGIPEFDLAYIDLQPFESGRLIPRSQLLDMYWHYRAEVDADIPCPEEGRARQLHADAVTALWLTTPASRVALQPFPQGTYPDMHWASQYRIIYNRLKSLMQEIKNQ
jgi:phosphotransferase family enzyme